MKEDRILSVLPRDIRRMIQREELEYAYLQEIKLRAKKPLLLIYRGGELVLGDKGDSPTM